MRREGQASPESEKAKRREPILGVEKGDLRQAIENLKIVNSWLILIVKPAWLDYKLSSQAATATKESESTKSPSAQKSHFQKRARKDYEKYRDTFVKVLEKGFELPSNNKIKLLQLVSKVAGDGPEDSQAFKDLFYFKNSPPEEKGKFIKNFEIVYYMEKLSSASITLERRLKSMSLADQLKVKQSSAQGPQKNFNFETHPQAVEGSDEEEPIVDKYGKKSYLE